MKVAWIYGDCIALGGYMRKSYGEGVTHTGSRLEGRRAA